MRKVVLSTMAIISALLLFTGCSDSPVEPENIPGTQLANSQSAESSNTHLWGLYDVSIDIEKQTASVIPNRQAMFTANVVNFDRNVSPTSPDYPVPPGLWSMNMEQMMLLWSYDVPLPWPGVEGTDATTRMYEVCRGMGDTSAVWHTYVVTFNYGPNAYEFVMLIPMTESDERYMNRFWACIENVEIEIE